jgi:hypothetical protein
MERGTDCVFCFRNLCLKFKAPILSPKSKEIQWRKVAFLVSSCHNFDSYEGFMALFGLDKGLDYQGKYVDLRQFLFMLKFTQGSARSGMRVSMGMVTMVYRFTD